MKKRSIYEYIVDHTKSDGKLDNFFDLNIYANTPITELGFRDFVADLDQRARNEKMYNLITETLLNLNDKNITKSVTSINHFFASKAGKDELVIYATDDILSFVRENIEKIDKRAYFGFLYALMTKSYQIEAVKLGISMYINHDYLSDVVLGVLMALGICEEFTFFVNAVFEWQSNGEELRFTLLKRVDGYGKICIVATLNTDNKDILEWLTIFGVDNKCGNEKLASLVAEKINLPKVLKREDLTIDEFRGICKIIEGFFLDIDNEESIEEVCGNYLEMLTNFLTRLESFKYNVSFLNVALEIAQYIGNKEDATPDEINMFVYIGGMLTKKDITEFLGERIKIGDKGELAVITRIFNFLDNSKYYDDIFEKFKQSPFICGFCTDYLLRFSEDDKEIISLLEDEIKKERITLNLKPVIYEGDWYYSALANVIASLVLYNFKSEKIIIAGLKCEDANSRFAALMILEVWMENEKTSLKKRSKAIYDALKEVKEKEVIKELKERINKLLGIEEDLSNYKDVSVTNFVKRSVNINDDIEVMFDEIVASDGFDYYLEKKVLSCFKSKKGYTAYVKGNGVLNEYKVDIYCDKYNYIEEMHCTCGEENCEHEYAVLKYIKDRYLKIKE